MLSLRLDKERAEVLLFALEEVDAEYAWEGFPTKQDFHNDLVKDLTEFIYGND